jgi:hypothetical protein
MSVLNLFSLPFNHWGATTVKVSPMVELNQMVFIKSERTLLVGRHAWYKLMFHVEHAPTNRRYIDPLYPLDHIDEAFEQCKKVALDYINDLIDARVREALQPTPKEQIDFIEHHGMAIPNYFFANTDGI